MVKGRLQGKSLQVGSIEISLITDQSEISPRYLHHHYQRLVLHFSWQHKDFPKVSVAHCLERELGSFSQLKSIKSILESKCKSRNSSTANWQRCMNVTISCNKSVPRQTTIHSENKKPLTLQAGNEQNILHINCLSSQCPHKPQLRKRLRRKPSHHRIFSNIH